MVTPSDALVIDTAEFARCIAVALEKTADSQAIVTLGMKPTRPETGYGYIAAQGEAGNAKVGGRVDMYNCRNCVVHAAEHRQVVLEGLEGYIVAEKDGRLLVCRLSEEQRIKDFAAGK